MEQYFSKRELKFNDRFTQFARIAAKQAMADSGLNTEEEDMERFGVLIGSGIGGIETIETAQKKHGEQRAEPCLSVLHPDDAHQSGSRHGRHRLGLQRALLLHGNGMCRCQQRDR